MFFQLAARTFLHTCGFDWFRFLVRVVLFDEEVPGKDLAALMSIQVVAVAFVVAKIGLKQLIGLTVVNLSATRVAAVILQDVTVSS